MSDCAGSSAACVIDKMHDEPDLLMLLEEHLARKVSKSYRDAGMQAISKPAPNNRLDLA